MFGYQLAETLFTCRFNLLVSPPLPPDSTRIGRPPQLHIAPLLPSGRSKKNPAHIFPESVTTNFHAELNKTFFLEACVGVWP